MTRACYAIDVGGTKIAAALVTVSGDVLASARRPTRAALGGASVLREMAACLDELGSTARHCELAGIGISAAGVIDRQRVRVADATDAMPGWKGQELGQWFGQYYGLPVAAANDVHCALMGELWRAPALCEAHGSVAMLTLGTGIGGALAVGGRVQAGRHGLAGHFGRTLAWDALAGAHVPLDALVSGNGLARLYLQRAGHAAAADGAAVMAMAGAGEPIAAEALDAWLGHLARQLHNLYWSLDPDCLVLGGGVIDSRQIWWDALLARLASAGTDLRIIPAALGNQAGVLGAARLAWTTFENA